MNITWINHVGMIGGAERSLLEDAQALDTRGLSIHILAPDGPLHAAIEPLGIAHTPIPPMPLQRPHSPLGYLRTAATMRPVMHGLTAAVQSTAPDLIHANSTTAALYALHAASHLPAPLLWHCRDMVPLGRIGRILARRCAVAIATSATVAHTLIEICPPHKIATILNGIATDEFTPLGITEASRHQFDLPQGVPLVGMVAHLVPWKRHDLFLAAAARIRAALPAAHFVIVGGDPLDLQPDYAIRLRDIAAQPDLAGAVTRIEQLPADRMPALYDAIDVLIHPADREPFGRVICEALCMETPVVSVAAGGVTEIVRARTDGLLVPPDDAPALAQAALSILSSPSLATRLAASGRRHVLRNFAVDRVADDLLSLYLRLRSA